MSNIYIDHNLFECKHISKVCLDLSTTWSSIRYQVSDVRYQVSGIRYQVSGIRYQVPGTRNQASGTRYPGIQVSRTHQLRQYMIVIRVSLPRQHFWIRQVHHCLFSIVVCASLDSSSIPNPPMQASRSRDTECHAAPYRGAF